MSTKLEIESFENGNGFSETLTHSKFEELNINLFHKTMKPIEQDLKDAGVKKEDISDIFLFSGSTRIPKVQQLNAQRKRVEALKGLQSFMWTLAFQLRGFIGATKSQSRLMTKN
ncbi:ATPase with role in protein import into the ER [Ceratobasidium sp. 423]|nr:ATPase with role in protein import into the ER [Ceratobasidium sp. 423]